MHNQPEEMQSALLGNRCSDAMCGRGSAVRVEMDLLHRVSHLCVAGAEMGEHGVVPAREACS